MNESLELLGKLNWFLKPISKIILFFFTSKLGFTLLILLIVFFFLILLMNRFRMRGLLNKAAGSQTKLLPRDFISILIEEVVSIFAKIISNITVLAVVLFLLFAIVGLSTTFSTVETYMQNQKKIKELRQVVKNLNQRYKVAKIEILDYDAKRNSTKLKISFYDYAQKGFAKQNQVLSLPGKKIYFLTHVINFDYSLIEAGEAKNIAIPYCIFSEKMKQEDGIMLNVADTSGIPFIFNRNEEDLYGINIDKYNEYMKEIMNYMTDEEVARQAGIRSSYVSAPSFVKVLRKGQTFIIWIEQTGGLVVKQEEDW